MAQTVLVGTKEGLHEVGGPQNVQLAGHDVTSLARDADAWWAIIGGSELWHREDSHSWTPLAVG